MSVVKPEGKAKKKLLPCV